MKNSADLGGCYPPRPSLSVDNTLLDLQNSSYPTQPHSIIANYYSFKIFPRFGLVETTRIILHNQLLFTKFGKNLRHIQSMTSKVEPAANYSTVDVKMTSKVDPAANYSTVDVKMTSKVEPAADYSTVDRKKPGDEIVILVSRKTKSETAKLH